MCAELIKGNSVEFLKPNTPAGDYWFLYIVYTTDETIGEVRIPIAFLPTGEIDTTHTTTGNLTIANELLAPTIAIVRLLTGDSSFDLWKLLNWMFVGYYWAFLADLRQVAPTAYDRTVANNPLPVTYASTNNVFVNETLFNIYSIYIQETILPIIQSFGSDISLFQWLVPLNNITRLYTTETTFLRTYSCSKREKKVWVSLLISVVAADYALIVGTYRLFLFIMGWNQRRKDEGDPEKY